MKPAETRTIDLAKLIEHRNALYHAAALCEALHQGLEHLEVANGLPELLLTIENSIDAAAEAVHVLTFPEKAGRAAS